MTEIFEFHSSCTSFDFIHSAHQPSRYLIQEITSTWLGFCLWWKTISFLELKPNKLASLDKGLDGTINVHLINFDRFEYENLSSNFVTVNTDNDLNKQTSNFLAPHTLKHIFGWREAMAIFLGFYETPPALERSFKSAAKVNRELLTNRGMENIPLTELPSLVKDIHARTQENLHNIDGDMRTFLRIANVLQTINDELVNTVSKLTEINDPIKKKNKMSKEAEDDFALPWFAEQRQLYNHRLEDL